ncbi:MAG: cyclic-di-GMP-binding protein [Methyloprofundus sp.]|nr:MAG: cyclic-di-GMP-binding protein [Methyloprofundus sp.]
MHYEFKAPEASTAHVPFNNINGLHDWLDNLTTLDSIYYYQEILCVLQALKTFKLSSKEHINALKKINMHLTNSVKHFDNNYWDTKFPLAYEQFSKVEIITWAYAELANNYYQLAIYTSKQKSFFSSKKNTAFLLYQALQATSQVYLKISSCYALPYSGFWTSLYQLYFFAEQQSLLTTPISINKHEKKTTEQAFINILLLSLCDMHQFRPRDMQQIYDFLSYFSSYSHIHTTLSSTDLNRVRSFHQHQDAPLLPETSTTKRGFVDYRYLMFTESLNEIFGELSFSKPTSSTLNKFNQAIFLRAYKSLTSIQKRQHTRISNRCVGNGVIGLEDIIKFHKKNTQLTEGIADTFLETRTITNKPANEPLPLSLVDEDHYIDIAIKEKSNITSHNNIFNESNSLPEAQNGSMRIEEFEIINSTFKGHQILWNNSSEKLQIGNVFGMVSAPSHSIEIGLVRRMSTTESSLIIGIELLSIESLVICISSPSTPEQKISCILLNQDSLLFSANHFQSGEEIYLFINHNKILCHLGQSLHSTTSVNHFELLFPHEQRLGIT